MKTKENLKNNNFTNLTRSGISLIVLVITIIVIIILAAAVIITLNNNNPIMEANTARYESDRANIQAVFTNAVAKVMAKNQATVNVSPGQINTITGGVKEIEGQVAYTLTDAQDVNNSTGTIIFDNKTSMDDTVFYTGKKLPIYAAGETKWYVDDEGNISLEVAGTKYGNGVVNDSLNEYGFYFDKLYSYKFYDENGNYLTGIAAIFYEDGAYELGFLDENGDLIRDDSDEDYINAPAGSAIYENGAITIELGTLTVMNLGTQLYIANPEGGEGIILALDGNGSSVSVLNEYGFYYNKTYILEYDYWINNEENRTVMTNKLTLYPDGTLKEDSFTNGNFTQTNYATYTCENGFILITSDGASSKLRIDENGTKLSSIDSDGNVLTVLGYEFIYYLEN